MPSWLLLVHTYDMAHGFRLDLATGAVTPWPLDDISPPSFGLVPHPMDPHFVLLGSSETRLRPLPPP